MRTKQSTAFCVARVSGISGFVTSASFIRRGAASGCETCQLQRGIERDSPRAIPVKPLLVGAAMAGPLKGMGVASAITTAGITQVVGLLATRPFMLKANQFMGIKAAHAIPILIIGT